MSLGKSLRERLRIAVHNRHRKRYWRNHDPEGYSCPSCGYDGDWFEVHHRDGDWLNGHPMNLVAVCHRCHRSAHRARLTADAVGEWKDSLP